LSWPRNLVHPSPTTDCTKPGYFSHHDFASALNITYTPTEYLIYYFYLTYSCSHLLL
jgi:hypothetical protein